MKLLVNGCSFTCWPLYPSGPNTCWPKHLGELDTTLDITLLAEPAAGNQYICDSVIASVLKSRPDHVLVMWSGVSRLDYLTSLEDPAWEEMYDQYGFYRRMDACPNKLGYIFSGGQIGTWFNNPVAHKMFKEMYKVSSPTSLGYINLMEMIKLQQFLKSMNISYNFMSYVNYWTSDQHVSRNGDFGVYSCPELTPLINAIDFDPWIFSNTRRDGIFEIAKELNDFRNDNFHPGDHAHQRWAELVHSRLPIHN